MICYGIRAVKIDVMDWTRVSNATSPALCFAFNDSIFFQNDRFSMRAPTTSRIALECWLMSTLRESQVVHCSVESFWFLTRKLYLWSTLDELYEYRQPAILRWR